jgi:hypothetical protein
MRTVIAVAVVAVLAGCGVDAASTAATVAAMKKQEIEDGKRTLQQAQQKIDSAMQQVQQRADSAEQSDQ